jgi:hypothetical protein
MIEYICDSCLFHYEDWHRICPNCKCHLVRKVITFVDPIALFDVKQTKRKLTYDDIEEEQEELRRTKPLGISMRDWMEINNPEEYK